MTISALLFLALAAPTTLPASAPAKPPIIMDASHIKNLTDYSERAHKLSEDWFTKIADILGPDATTDGDKITIIMDEQTDIIAYATGGNEIHVSTRYVDKHLDDMGMIIHEMAHIVQGYPKYDPVWLVEGIADYVRFFKYEPQTIVRVNPEKANARQSYRTTAAFLDWTSRKYDKDLVKKLNSALKKDTYTEATFKQLTGKTLDQLNDEWIAALKAAPKAALATPKP